MPHKTIRFCIFFLLLTAIFSCFRGGETLPLQAPKLKDNKFYGVTKGLFRHRWWNYYERGLSFAEGGYWKEAKDDLREAIRQRKNDKRRARTYGMHFIDYFPHRELGIILYREENFKSAIEELTASLSAEESARAGFYIDKARKARIEKAPPDPNPPRISIEFPSQPFSTDAFSITLKGTASSDNFVDQIMVGGEKVVTDFSNQKISFQKRILLHPGKNEIQINARDLMGKTSHASVTVNVNRIVPIATTESPSDSVRSQLSETSGLLAQHTASAELMPSEGFIVAQLTLPRIELEEDQQKIRTTYLDEDIIEGFIIGSRKAERVSVRAISASGIPQKEDIALNRNQKFKVKVGLELGKNEFTFKCRDAEGHAAPPLSVQIIRRESEARKLRSRLRIGLNYFRPTGKLNYEPKEVHHLTDRLKKIFGVAVMGKLDSDENTRSKRSLKFEDMLLKDLHDRKRFCVADLGLTGSERRMNDREAFEVAKQEKVDCMLTGSVTEWYWENGVDISARLVDTETRIILAMDNIYDENVDENKLRELSKELEIKLTQKLPVVEGKILTAKGKRFTVDIGKKNQIQEDMKLIVFETSDSDEQMLGEARIMAVDEKTSRANLSKQAEGTSVEPNHSVITK